MITDIFMALNEALIGFVGIFVTLLGDNGVTAVFYNDAGLTLVGGLLLLGFGYALVKYGLNWIRSLISLKKL